MAPFHLYPTSTFESEITILKDDNITNGLESTFSMKKKSTSDIKTPEQFYRWNIVWKNVVIFTILHLISIFALYDTIINARWTLFLYSYLYGVFVAQGITAGAHRLWAHRSYKAKLPLKVFLLFLQTSAFQNSLYVWVRDHRLHHKFTDTDADPHNSKRGFFFSHMGWLFLRKEEEVKIKGKALDMSDITSDRLVMFQHKYYWPLMLVCCFFIPTFIPWYFFEQDFYICFCGCGVFRYIYSVHCTWLVNSAAHMFGMKPYDSTINPSENLIVSHLTCGEGFHNFHHVFPWDYKASELGNYGFNWSLMFINFCARLGLAYDLKTVSSEIVAKRAKRTGDGSRKIENENTKNVWGWGDKDIPEEDLRCAEIIN